MNPFASNSQLVGLMRRYLFSSICIILSVILLMGIWILWLDIHTLEALNRESSQEGQAMLSTMVSAPLVKQELAHAQDIVQRIENNLVVESKLEDNIGYFYRIQKQTKAEIVFLRQQATPPGDDGLDYKAIPYTLQISGTYEQVAGFMLELETGPKLSQIRTFSFHRRENNADSLSLNLDLRLLGKR